MNLSVRVNPGSQRDEVFITSDSKDPNYVNRVVYAKPGIFKDGNLSSDEIAILEQKSNQALEEGLKFALIAEEKAREQSVKAPVKPKKEE